MRIIHLIPNMECGGAEKYLDTLLHFQADGLEQELVTVFDGCPQGGLHRVYRFFLAFYRIFRMASNPRPGRSVVVVGWMYHCCVLVSFLKLVKPSIKVVWQIRHTLGSRNCEKKQTWVCVLSLKFLRRVPQEIVFNSKRSMTQHRRLLQLKAENCLCIYNGVDFDRYKFSLHDRSRFRNRLKIQPNCIVFSVVARSHPMKRVDEVIRSFSAVQSTHGCSNPMHLLLIGRGMSEFRCLIDGLRLHDFVTFIDQSENVPEYLCVTDCLIMNSGWGEGCPNAVCEAMACGCDVIATNIGDTAAIASLANGNLILPDLKPESLSSYLRMYAELWSRNTPEYRASKTKQFQSRFLSRDQSALKQMKILDCEPERLR